ncbi:RNA polymerase sigma factor [Candidatus Poribacteria bacterium]
MRTEDGYIVHKCLNGDTAAFGLLVDKYKASIYALAYSKLHNFHDAEDITQEAFLKAYEKLRTLKWWDNFLAWLYAITSNLCKQWIRSQSKRPDRDFIADQSPDAANRPSMDSYQEDMARELLHEALDSISESYRQVLTLYYLGGMNSIEIARFLGTSPNNIAQRLRRARAKLKTEMITAMDETAQQQKLRVDFTFRIVEMVKRMKIQALPRTPWLPWGMSAVAGTVLTVLCFASLITLFIPIRISQPDSGGVRVELPSYLEVEILPSVDVPDTSVAYGTLGHQGNAQGIYTGQTRPVTTAPPVAQNIQETMVISGKVVKNNVPVPNAQVNIYARDDLRQEITTQADGSFQIEIPKPDDEDWEKMLLTAKAPHPHDSFGWVRLPRKKVATTVISLHDPVAITGTILDELGDLHSGPLAQNLTFRRLPGEPELRFNTIQPETAGEMGFGPQIDTDRFRLELIRPAAPIRGYPASDNIARSTTDMGSYTYELYLSVIWARPFTYENTAITLENLPGTDYNLYNIGLAQAAPTWLPRASEYIQITEARTYRNTDVEMFSGGILARSAPNQLPDDPMLPDYIIDPYRSRQGLQSVASSDNTDKVREGSYRAVPWEAAIYTSAPKIYENASGEGEGTYVTENRMFSHVDFQFQKDTTLIVTFRGKSATEVMLTNKPEQIGQYGRWEEDGRFTIIGLASGQKFSVKAESGDLQLSSYADAKAQPAAEVEILMEKHRTPRVAGQMVSKPTPSTNVGLIMYLYSSSGVE